MRYFSDKNRRNLELRNTRYKSVQTVALGLAMARGAATFCLVGTITVGKGLFIYFKRLFLYGRQL